MSIVIGHCVCMCVPWLVCDESLLNIHTDRWGFGECVMMFLLQSHIIYLWEAVAVIMQISFELAHKWCT